jgi:hypothetical protein
MVRFAGRDWSVSGRPQTDAVAGNLSKYPTNELGSAFFAFI